MTAMLAIDARYLQVAGLALVILSMLLLSLPASQCPDCQHCREKRAADAKRKAGESHDYEHRRGLGRDSFNCRDEACRRNKRGNDDAEL